MSKKVKKLRKELKKNYKATKNNILLDIDSLKKQINANHMYCEQNSVRPTPYMLNNIQMLEDQIKDKQKELKLLKKNYKRVRSI